jgi:ATP phosphoribosyltransferase regulatory subunit
MLGSNSSLSSFAPEDILAQQRVARQLTDFYIQKGFESVDIPTIVDMSLVSKANSKFTQNVFKLFDESGKTLALRTELTQPLAKMVANYHSKLTFPQKYFYDASVFRFKGSHTDSSKEIKQVGVEVFGKDAGDIDEELICLILDSLKELKIKEAKISITDTRIWQKIFEIYGAPNYSFEEELEKMMNSDSYKSTLASDKELSLAAKLYKALLERNIVRFRKLIKNQPDLQLFLSSNKIEDFEKLLEIDLSLLKRIDSLSDNVVFDPLQCPDLKLYTGLHFMLYAKGSGSMLALGGRYDTLCGQFGAEIPAIGFAFYVKELSNLVEKKVQRNKLRIAIAKGGLFDDAKEFLSKKSFKFADDKNRKLILEVASKLKSPFDEVEVLLVRGHDVPVYVEHGAADLGIVGLDVVLDSKTSNFLVKDLEYGHCRLSVCARKGLYKSVYDLPKQTRVATTFPNLTKEFFDLKGVSAEIINLYGSVELGPLTDLSDVIVDLVATGKTLKENDLEEVESFLDCSAYLIANKASFKLYSNEILEF